ncbi:Hpt domain-containing protein [Variovorax ginsengisoli]|uniref:HPt (Histidine-containing phosphotransfer) domain-containing protein n=1 Tax=Variovorax ginsengisoli TaxID=363844 RepID=A0ABT9SD45_9BURK|nr:Hpt domain-containing protein [Variovorax ginsengisoli]MDP9902264.1 HPt (histidine-containing phosphotransfer) domain-containing protein [Variovorax ginsengisoli]
MRQRFVAGLAARWAEIVAAESDAQRQFLLHRMSGAAGSFGFDELSVVARRAEAAAEAAMAAGGRNAQALETLCAMIDGLVRSSAFLQSPPHKETP